MKNWKILTFSAIVCAFFVQGFFVYSNYAYPKEQISLSDQGKLGMQIFRANNCQSCHQIHGFGGFLGPDLTNVSRRSSETELTEVLINGRMQMPAFKFSAEDIQSLLAFFNDLNKTGNAYPTILQVPPVEKLGVEAMKLAQRKSPVKRKMIENGLKSLIDNGCRACHKPFKQAAGPDLSLAFKNRKRDYMISNIKNGRGAMPAFAHLSDNEINEILYTIYFIGKNRTRLNKNSSPSADVLWDLPWFEF